MHNRYYQLMFMFMVQVEEKEREAMFKLIALIN